MCKSDIFRFFNPVFLLSCFYAVARMNEYQAEILTNNQGAPFLCPCYMYIKSLRTQVFYV